MIVQANALRIPLQDKSVQTVVTSPPYYGLRDYGTARWIGGEADCDHLGKPVPTRAGFNERYFGRSSTPGNKQDALLEPFKKTCGKCGAIRIDDQIGLEETPEEYVAKIVEVFHEVWRVLRDDGTVWLVLGDGWASSPGQRKTTDKVGPKQRSNPGSTGAPSRSPTGLKPKDLIGIPWRVAFALQADGWFLRQDLIWHKKNPMPESVTDRCTKAHEYIFLLSKSARYYFDFEAIEEPVVEYERDRRLKEQKVGVNTRYNRSSDGRTGQPDQSQSGACRSAERRQELALKGTRRKRSVWTVPTQSYKEAHFATFPPRLIWDCILAGCPVGGIVLDPFGGTGTTGRVAKDLGRRAVICELSWEYCRMAQKRTKEDRFPLLAGTI